MQTKDPNLTKTPIADDSIVDNKQTIKTETAEQIDNSIQKGTNTLTDDEVDSEHVKQEDNPARQPDRRDQQGSAAFDNNVNKETISDEQQTDSAQKQETTEQPQSDEITDENRYATVDNAQTRVLDEDSK